MIPLSVLAVPVSLTVNLWLIFPGFLYAWRWGTHHCGSLRCYRAWKSEGKPGGRKEFLRRVARIQGVYVPSFYTVTYHADGTIKSVTPNEPGVPATVYKRVEPDINDLDFRPIQLFLMETRFMTGSCWNSSAAVPAAVGSAMQASFTVRFGNEHRRTSRNWPANWYRQQDTTK